ncbi:hypothetical protein A9Q86_07725 [Flavobacteriales bacterium 33_180_T64]|nr:hypothetical protein A9Q86_07725 [Flavobacteriales bacterium 33_180_T64]
MAVPNIILGLVLFIFILGVSTKRLQLYFTRRNWLIYVIISIPLLLTIVSVLHSSNMIDGLKHIWKRLPILIIPFVLIFGKYDKKHIKTGLSFFVSFTVIASLVALYNAGKYFNEDILFKTDFAHFITLIQHPYFGIYTLIALLSIFELGLIKHRALKIIICLLFVCVIMLTTSRLVYILLLSYSCYFLFKNLSRKRFIGFTILLAALVIAFLGTNQKIANKFKSTVEYDNSPRLQLWNNSLRVVEKQNAYIFGIGIGDYYSNKKDTYYAKGRDSGMLGLNPHSQVFEFYITNGVLGILILGSTLFVFVVFLRQQERITFFLFSIIFLFSLSECIFSRQYGVQLYCVLIPILLTESFNKIKNEVE